MVETVILGGGQTGRGFIGRLLCESGIPFVIVDQDRKLIDALNRKGGYRISFFSQRPPVTVSGFEAYHTDSPQASKVIKNAKNIFISVGAQNLERAAKYLFDNKTSPKNVILCENAINPSGIVREVFIKSANCTAVNVVETAVYCITMNVKDDPVDILSEEVHKLNYNAKSSKSSFFKAPFFEPEADF